MKTYNRSDDVIHTSLFGGEKIAKDSLIVDAYGTIDELNSFLGMARVRIDDSDIRDILKQIQQDLFRVGSDLATPMDKSPVERISNDDISGLEKVLERYDRELPQINRFILPGGSVESALLHIARSVARRAERRLVTVKKERQINENVPMYINRLSDLLFVLARTMNKRKGVGDEFWGK